MHKPLTAALIPLLLLVATAAATPDAYTLNQINSTHWYFESTQYDLAEGTYSYQAFANNISTDNQTITYTTAPPLNDATTGNFWVQHTWNAVTGADGYNVSINSVWHNQTATNYNNTIISPHGWSNITLASYNAATGVSSFISDDVQIPNNAITITNYSDHTVTVGDNVTVDLDYADLDGDTPTFSCNRTDFFADFNTATGTGTWAPPSYGTTSVNFGVSDGHGSTDSYTMTITVTHFSVKLTARAAGVEGNSIVTTETCENASFTASTLTGGRAGDITGEWADSDAPTGAGMWGDVGGMIGIALLLAVVALVIGYLRRATE